MARLSRGEHQRALSFIAENAPSNSLESPASTTRSCTPSDRAASSSSFKNPAVGGFAALSITSPIRAKPQDQLLLADRREKWGRVTCCLSVYLIAHPYPIALNVSRRTRETDSCFSLPHLAESRKESRRPGHIPSVFLAKLGQHFSLFATCKLHVHRHENRKHDESDDCRLLEKKTQHDEYEAIILRVANVSVRTCQSKGLRMLRIIEHFPSSREKNKSAEDQNIAQNVERIKVRVDLPTQKRVPQVSRIMGKRIKPRIPPHQPARNEIDGQRKSVHLNEQCHN